jgi:hypothetical protein
MKSTWLLLLLITVPVSAQTVNPAVPVPPGLTVVEQDQWGVTLELLLPSYRLDEIQGSQGPCQRVLLDGWARTASAGLPELPVLGCALELPPDAGFEARILDAEYRYHPVQRVHAVPRLTVENVDGVGTPEFEEQQAAGLGHVYPASLVEVEPAAVRRGRRQARVLFHPFQWDPGSGQLRCATRLVVRLSYRQPSSFVRSTDPAPSPVPSTRDGYQGLLHPTPGSFLQGALRIEVEEDGLYAMDYGQAMQDAGLSHVMVEDLDPATLKLFCRGREVPILVAGDDHEAPWPGGDLFFYGQGVDSRFTGFNVYWLCWGGTAGARMGTRDGGSSGGGALVSSTMETVRYEENHRLWEATPGTPDADYWFWDLLTAPLVKNCPVEVHNPDPGAWDGTLRVCYQGRSTAPPHPNHHTRIFLNGVDLGDQYWDGDKVVSQELQVPAGLLTDGWNTVTVDCPGDTGATVDSVYLNWIELEYRRKLNALDDQLCFTARGEGPLHLVVHGFTDPQVAVLDVSDPYDVKQVPGVRVTEAGGQYTAAFGGKVAGAATFLALTTDRFRAPANVECWTSPGLRGGGQGADYILITPREFLPAAEPLVQYRRDQGLRARAVAVEDIYNEFNHGLPDPAALKAFLRCAYHDWEEPAPAFILLLGDANTDYLDYFGSGKQSLVPVHLSQSELGLTPDDNWYVTVEGGDVLPEMYIGRLPASDPAMADRVVTRLLAHEQSPAAAPGRSLFVADNEQVFENLNETVAAMLPPGIQPDRVYLSAYPVTGEATADIVRAINRGEMIVHYNGHGSVTSWAGEGLFQVADVVSLTNGDALTFVLTMTCLNGYFSQPFHYCLAEELASAEFGGALGCFSPSGLSYTWEQDLLAPQVFSQIFGQGEDRLGVIVTEAKLVAHALGATDGMVSMFTLLGDPASRLKSWE